MPTNFETSFRLFMKLLPLVRWYLMGGTLVVVATAFLTWCNDNVSGQNDLLMVFLAGILMLTFLFCIPLAIMNYLSKDYFFTAAVGVLAFFMVRAHSTVMDTLGVGNIQMQACMVFLGVCLGAAVAAYVRNIEGEDKSSLCTLKKSKHSLIIYNIKKYFSCKQNINKLMSFVAVSIGAFFAIVISGFFIYFTIGTIPSHNII